MEEILHQLIWRIYHYLQGFTYLRWCRISSINSVIAFSLNLGFWEEESSCETSSILGEFLNGSRPQFRDPGQKAPKLIV